MSKPFRFFFNIAVDSTGYQRVGLWIYLRDIVNRPLGLVVFAGADRSLEAASLS